MKDLDLGQELEKRLLSMEDWACFHYKSHVLGGTVLG